MRSGKEVVRSQSIARAPSRDAFDTAFGASRLGVAAVARSGTVLRCNEALTAMLGEPTAHLSFDRPEDDVLFTREDGTSLWVHVVVTPLERPLDGLAADAYALVYVVDVNEGRSSLDAFANSAAHDPLTQLPNRAAFIAALVATLLDPPARAEATCFFIGLDEFRPINDTLGHAAGDIMLRATATKLRGLVAPSDIVARLDGDEFAVLAFGHDAQRAVEFGNAVLAALRVPTQIGERAVVVSASIGMVALCDDYDSAESVLRDADAAMYRAKERGRRCIVVFDESMRRSAQRRARLLTDLPASIENGQVHMAFQPVVDLFTRRVAGFEALARWNHPIEGVVPPIEFIPLAENSDAIFHLGRLAIRAACAFLRDLEQAAFGALSCSVNVSVYQILATDLVADIRETLAEHALDPGRLTVEITEGVVLESKPKVLETLRALRELGVSLSLDDFGTGYSSLRYLHQFPIDILKIDRAFVNGPDGQLASEQIVDMVTNLAQSLDMIVIAEGIEHPDQADLLQAHGCRFGQGYYFSRPLAGASVFEWLREHFT